MSLEKVNVPCYHCPSRNRASPPPESPTVLFIVITFSLKLPVSWLALFLNLMQMKSTGCILCFLVSFTRHCVFERCSCSFFIMSLFQFIYLVHCLGTLFLVRGYDPQCCYKHSCAYFWHTHICISVTYIWNNGLAGHRVCVCSALGLLPNRFPNGYIHL